MRHSMLRDDSLIRFLALGDSYTIGEGVLEHERWPNQLADRLRGRGYEMDVAILARTGWTTGELADAIRAAPPVGRYDLVSLLIGVNNQYRGLDLDSYRAEFSSLLEQSLQFADGRTKRVIVLSVPDWSVAPFAAEKDRARLSVGIEAFNAVIRDESARAGVRYVDVTPVSRLAMHDPSLLASDQLHPSGRMYLHWVDLILPEALAALEEIPLI
jgi:lysophospholipase L1-like esterase